MTNIPYFCLVICPGFHAKASWFCYSHSSWLKGKHIWIFCILSATNVDNIHSRQSHVHFWPVTCMLNFTSCLSFGLKKFQTPTACKPIAPDLLRVVFRFTGKAGYLLWAVWKYGKYVAIWGLLHWVTTVFFFFLFLGNPCLCVVLHWALTSSSMEN